MIYFVRFCLWTHILAIVCHTELAGTKGNYAFYQLSIITKEETRCVFDDN